MSLFDVLKSKTQQAPATVAPQQQQIQKTLQTKATGKAVQQTGPAASTVQQSQATDVFRTQEKQQAQQEQIQQQQLRSQAERVEEESAEKKAQLQFQADLQQQGIKTKEIQALSRIRNEEELATFRRQGSEIMKTAAISHQANRAFYELSQQQKLNINNFVADLKQSQAQLEADKQMTIYDQRSFVAALRSKEYVQKINQIGAMQRLQDDANFKEEALRVTMGHRASILHNQLMAEISARNKARIEDAARLASERSFTTQYREDERQATSQQRQTGREYTSLIEAEKMTGQAERAALRRDEASARNREKREADRRAAIEQANREIALAEATLRDELKKMKFEAGSQAIQGVVMQGVQMGMAGDWFGGSGTGTEVGGTGTVSAFDHRQLPAQTPDYYDLDVFEYNPLAPPGPL